MLTTFNIYHRNVLQQRKKLYKEHTRKSKDRSSTTKQKLVQCSINKLQYAYNDSNVIKIY
jgi:hypothetical protein